MQKRIVKIKDKHGLHARPASDFVMVANSFKCNVKILKDQAEIDGKSVMGVLTLAATCGTELTIITDGEDETVAIEKLENILKQGGN